MSAKNDAYKPEVLLQSQHRRQALLDILNASQGMDYYALCDAMAAHPGNYPSSSMRGTIANMIHRGEIESRGEKKAGFRFFANVQTTISAELLLANHKAKGRACNHRHYDARVQNKGVAQRAARRSQREIREAAEAAEAAKKAEKARRNNLGCPRYVHEPGKHPNADSRGQGALRPRVHVNCYQNY